MSVHDLMGKWKATAAGTNCKVPGCDRVLRSKESVSGLCNMHYLRLRRTGSLDLSPRVPVLKRKPPCRIEGCSQPVYEHRLCAAHRLQQQKAREAGCEVSGCDGVVRTKGLCSKHYNRVLRIGSTELPKNPGAGRSEHPLYLTWKKFIAVARRLNIEVCDKWKNDFWNFVADMGTRPTRAYSLIRIDEDGPYSSDNCMWATAAQRHAEQMKVVPLSSLTGDIIKPGIEKFLLPLALYLGTRSMGRVHRMWNFAIAMMHTECRSFGQGVLLSHNEDYAQLCGPEAKLQNSSLYSFFSRLRLNPSVTDNAPGLTDYVGEMMPTPFDLTPVSIVSAYKNCAPWRTFELPKKLRQRGGGNVPANHVKTAQRCYPYVVWEQSNPINRLTALVHACVPRGLPDEIRADVCQDLIVDLLSGDLAEDALVGSPRKYFQAKMKAYRYGDCFGSQSLDSELIDILQFDEAKKRFDEEVGQQLDEFERDEDEFKDYMEQTLSTKFKVTRAA